jgi:ATP-dependent helicase IRC3
MIEEKWLSDVIFTTVQSKADISKVKSGASGDFQPGELSNAINTEPTSEITVRAWIARAGSRKSTIVFCVSLAHVSSLMETFRKHGIDARSITGDTAKQIRSERLDAFKNGEFPVLLNCGVFTEGTDIPNIDCVLLARPTKSRNLLVQMIGRGMRLCSGKKNCHVLDMVASLESGVVTTPTLFGLDPSEIIKDADVDQLKELRDRKEQEQLQREILSEVCQGDATSKRRPLNGSITFTDYGSVYDLIDDTSGERHIRAISPLAWVEVETDRYILSIHGGHFLTLERMAPKLWSVRHTSKIPDFVVNRTSKSPFMRPREVATAETFTDVVHAADTYASESFPWHFISNREVWRTKPASEGQIAFLNKFRAADSQLTSDAISKGKAGDMITKLKFGAKRRFGKIEVARRKEDKVKARDYQLANLKKRELVEVGPLAA